MTVRCVLDVPLARQLDMAASSLSLSNGGSAPQGEPDEVIVNSGSQGASHGTCWPVSRRVMGKDRSRSRMPCSSASAGYRQRIGLL